MSKKGNYKLIAVIIQAGTVFLAINFIWNKHLFLGMIMFGGTMFAEIGLPSSVRRDSTRAAVKFLLLMYGIMLWLIFVIPSRRLVPALQTGDSALYAKTRNIVSKKGRTHSHHYPLKKLVDSNIISGETPKAKEGSKALETSDSAGKIQRKVTSNARLPSEINSKSASLIRKVFGTLPASNFPDLKYRGADEVRDQFATVFSELPEEGFSTEFKNPCWQYRMAQNPGVPRVLEDLYTVEGEREEDRMTLACLPYAYVLGQPKCGTSDLFERLKRHPEIRMPHRKEVRWFTRGEFTTKPLHPEGMSETPHRGELGLSPESSIFSFTNAFDMATKDIAAHPETVITVDGGPHTLWWPTQMPDGSMVPESIPAPQIIREMQPDAKFIITLSDPVKRLYSDYYFLDDDRSVVRQGVEGVSVKSAEAFHERAQRQVEMMKSCVRDELKTLVEEGEGSEDSAHEGSPYWVRASQICAHDRFTLGKAGWGRLSIGLYVLYLEKWLEHFAPSQFLVVRLEDYDADPRGYMERVFSFLGVAVEDLDEEEWDFILTAQHANEYHGEREPILEETEALLRTFHAPYNNMLASLVEDEGFKWQQAPGSSLRITQIEKAAKHGKHAQGHNEGEKDEEKKERDEERERMRDIQWRKSEAIRAQRLDHRRAPRITRERGEENREGEEEPEDRKRDRRSRDRHGVQKHFEDDVSSDGDKPASAAVKPASSPIPVSLRGKGRVDRGKPGKTATVERNRTTILTPERFSIEGLSYPPGGEFNEWLSHGNLIHADRIKDDQDAAHQLCSASFALDLGALKYLLWDTGIPANVLDANDANRNAFHCLCMVHTMADAHSKSQVFAVLKGKPSWLTPYIQPPTPLLSHSVLSRDILDGLSAATEKAAQWLLAAGVSPSLLDSADYSPLHHASIGGLESLVRILLEAGVDVDPVNVEGRTPLHYAAAYGHSVVAGMLLDAGADPEIEDNIGTKASDIMMNPGPISAADAKQYLGMEQRKVRKIERVIHPELHTDGEKEGWAAGNGGWGTRRLAGYEDDMSCDIDQYWAHEISDEEIFRKYLSRGAPVLIRGLIEDWPVVQKYTHDALRADFGHLKVQVSDIPYAGKFGGAGNVDMNLSEYIDEVKEHRLVGGKHPWYVFRGHTIPSASEAEESLVKFEDLPTPTLIQKAFERMYPQTARGKEGLASREIYVNSQWALGGEGTGAPVHFHNTAWNALIYGAKKWILYPPHSMIMSNRQILDYFETDKMRYAERGVQGQSCVQVAGDVIIIPESWGHGVLNLQETVAVATEVKASIWRSRPATTVIGRLPNDNRRLGPK